jgi:DNA repair exonuclease SbcCD nuclease subunit
MKNLMNRRSILKASTAAIAILANQAFSDPLAARQDTAEPKNSSNAKRVLRFAHPTDIHVKPELRGDQGMTAAFNHMFNLADPPQMILTGGDLPFDTASSDQPRSASLWKLFDKIIGDTVPKAIPIHHTIGNHDIWGRDMELCHSTGNEPFFGKKWFLDNFGYQRTWYSFDQTGWHFVILDSFDLVPGSKDYIARIVGDQLDWLKADLAATPKTTPILIVTHVPIFSAANFFDDAEQKHSTGPDVTISHTRMHMDYRELDTLFADYPNIKLCLSGHLHLFDRVQYNGITHICDGAVCGDKWKGPRQRTPEGYGLIDLYSDGSFQHQYMPYGWKA